MRMHHCELRECGKAFKVGKNAYQRFCSGTHRDRWHQLERQRLITLARQRVRQKQVKP
jgi:hypothetical protein